MVVSINIDKETLLWITGAVIAAITAIGVFVGPVIAQRRQERIRKAEEKLRTHFRDLKSKVIEPLISVTYDISNNGEKILYENWPMTVEHPPTLPKYKFEQSDSFTYLKLHFPEIVAEWEKLKEKATNYDKSLRESMTEEKRKNLTSNAESIVRDFKHFASELDARIDTINKYELGKVFKKHKKCPICKKF